MKEQRIKIMLEIKEKNCAHYFQNFWIEKFVAIFVHIKIYPSCLLYYFIASKWTFLSEFFKICYTVLCPIGLWYCYWITFSVKFSAKKRPEITCKLHIDQLRCNHFSSTNLRLTMVVFYFWYFWNIWLLMSIWSRILRVEEEEYYVEKYSYIWFSKIDCTSREIYWFFWLYCILKCIFVFVDYII